MTITPPQPCRETAEELGCAEVRRLLALLLGLLLALPLALLLALLLTRRATEALLVLDDAALRLLPQDQQQVDCVMRYALPCALCAICCALSCCALYAERSSLCAMHCMRYARHLPQYHHDVARRLIELDRVLQQHAPHHAAARVHTDGVAQQRAGVTGVRAPPALGTARLQQASKHDA